MNKQNEESVEIVYNSTFGGFIIPEEILKYCVISEDDCDGWNLRTNKMTLYIKLKNENRYTLM